MTEKQLKSLKRKTNLKITIDSKIFKKNKNKKQQHPQGHKIKRREEKNEIVKNFKEESIKSE